METTDAVGGHQVFYRQEGQRGLLIVFLHCVPTSHHQGPAPATRTCRPTPNLIGRGRSDKPLECWDYTFANDARLLAALMAEWGHEQMVVVGDDWGGGIALTFAAISPQHTDLCVWMNSTTYNQRPEAEIETVARMATADEAEFPRSSRCCTRSCCPAMVIGHVNLTAGDLRAFREAYETVDYDQGGSLLRGDAAYGPPKIEASVPWRCVRRRWPPGWGLDLPCADIAAAAMGLWGKDDIFMDPVGLYRFKKDMRNAQVRLQTIPEAGHLAMVDQPHTVADAILDFVTEHRGLDALAQPYDGFPEVFGAQHVSEDFKGLWGST